MEPVLKGSPDSDIGDTVIGMKGLGKKRDTSQDKTGVTSEYETLVYKLKESETIWKKLVDSHLGSINEKVKDQVVSRFNELSESSDWGIGDLPVTRESARTFMELLKCLNPDNPPFIGCDHGGNVIMFWGGREEYLRFSCLPNYNADFYVSIIEERKSVKFCGHKHIREIDSELKKHKMVQRKFLNKK